MNKKFALAVLLGFVTILSFNVVGAQDSTAVPTAPVEEKTVVQEHCPPIIDPDFSASPVTTNGCFWFTQKEAVSFWMEGSLYLAGISHYVDSLKDAGWKTQQLSSTKPILAEEVDGEMIFHIHDSKENVDEIVNIDKKLTIGIFKTCPTSDQMFITESFVVGCFQISENNLIVLTTYNGQMDAGFFKVDEKFNYVSFGDDRAPAMAFGTFENKDVFIVNVSAQGDLYTVLNPDTGYFDSIDSQIPKAS